MWLYKETELSGFYSIYCNCDLLLETKMKKGKKWKSENKNKNYIIRFTIYLIYIYNIIYILYYIIHIYNILYMLYISLYNIYKNLYNKIYYKPS